MSGLNFILNGVYTLERNIYTEGIDNMRLIKVDELYYADYE